MHRGKWIVGLLLICFVAAEQSSSSSAAPKILGTESLASGGQEPPKDDEIPTQLIAEYRGVFPCADCPGIDMDLSLFATSLTDLSHKRYVLKQTYQERNTTRTETGAWAVLRGAPGVTDATVYQLRPEGGGQATNFLFVSSNEVRQLDSDRRRIKSNLNFSLKKVAPETSPAKPAS